MRTTTRAIGSVTLIVSCLVALQLIHGPLARPTRAQPSYECYFSQDCPQCEQSGFESYCESTQNYIIAGNCSGGTADCYAISACEVEKDCDTDDEIGECDALPGCVTIP